MSEKRIQRITITQTSAEARVTRGDTSENASEAITASGLAELRKRLYEAGFSKRAIASAVKNVQRNSG